METNNELREQILEIIKNQIKENDPPETKTTYDRLRKQGFDDFQTREMIAHCLGIELFNVIKFGKPNRIIMQDTLKTYWLYQKNL